MEVEKRCTMCNEVKPLTEFSPRKKGKLKAECRACSAKRYRAWYAKNKATQRAKQRKRYAANLESRREAARRRRQAQRKREGDAVFLENQRISHTLWRRRKGMAPVPQRSGFRAMDKEESVYLPVKPFRTWLNERLSHYDGVEDAASAMGITGRTIYRVLHESEKVRLDTVDHALTNEGSTSLAELYPEDLEDAA